ncbi:glycosyltransferase family 1 protein, partial [Candidatus Uhrbacteria bacterium]|nr:glycosyltransferase family 1 protein [Candidatus Uhrbacteria bacterium]
MNSAKKIVLAITLAEPGGAQSFVLGFAKWLKKNGHDVTVIAGDGTWLFEACTTSGISTIHLKHMGRAINPWRDFCAYVELKRVLRKLQPHTIHLNSTKMGVIGSLASYGSTVLSSPSQDKIPQVVYRIGGWVFLEPLSSIVKQLYVWAERWSAKYKDVIICVHPGDEAIARELNIKPKKKLITVPNGIDLENFDHELVSREEARRLLNLDSRATIIGTVAHLYPAKDLNGYFDAIAIVHRQQPHLLWIILGDGPERKQLEAKRAALHLESLIFLPGASPIPAAHLLKAFDLFVLPSAKEGMPWSLLEAMAAELPCIATDVGACQWMLDDKAGWIVPKQNPHALAEIILDALNHPQEAMERGKQAR